ncbi:MAG: agmatinase [Dissulfuribacterales bacterium]
MPYQFLPITSQETDREHAKIIVLPVPFDYTASYKTGARDGPQAILAASKNLELYDEETGTEVYTQGFYTLEPLEPVLPVEEMVRKIQTTVLNVLQHGQFPVVLGGDHSVSIGAIEAACKYFGRINIVQFDAHTDMRESYLGTPYSHACVMRRVWKSGNVIQIGQRATSCEEMEFLTAQNRLPIWAKDVIYDRKQSISKLLERLESIPTYITIDVDSMDPSIMPATGTPEPGGLSWFHLLECLRAVVAHTQIIGFDVVELSPIPGYHAADFLTARLIYKLASYIFSK